jgi:hypothetical protein
MSKFHRTVLDVLFPKVRARLLRELFTTPPQERYVREFALVCGLNIHTVHDELRKLGAVGFIISWSNGYHRFYQANREHPLYPEMCRIVELSQNLPRTRASPLRRARGRTGKRSRSHAPPPRLPKDWPIKWHLFSKAANRRGL